MGEFTYGSASDVPSVGDLFVMSAKAACNMGLEGLVSKRADRPYRAGRSRDWIKIKNRRHPAYRRVKDRF